jgi:hypothetical protein
VQKYLLAGTKVLAYRSLGCVPPIEVTYICAFTGTKVLAWWCKSACLLVQKYLLMYRCGRRRSARHLRRATGRQEEEEAEEEEAACIEVLLYMYIYSKYMYIYKKHAVYVCM